MNNSLLIGYHSNEAITGVSIAFDTLVNGFDSRNLPYESIDLSNGKGVKVAGEFNIKRGITTLRNILMAWFYLFKIDNVYIIISSSFWGFLRDILLIIPSVVMSKRVVLHLHGGGYRDFYNQQPKIVRILIREILNKADTIIVLSRLLMNQFDFLPSYPGNIVIVPNGLPHTITPGKPEPKILSSPLNILYMSNLIESKGYMDVLAACRIIRDDYKIPCKCHFCGSFIQTIVNEETISSAELLKNFINLIHEWKLDDIAQYHGNVYADIKKELLTKANILVLPTYYPWEGQPISIIEALASGTPVISTKFRGIPEQVVDNYNGFLVEPKSPRKIAEKVAYFWERPALYTAFSEHAINHYLSEFTTKKHLDKLIPVILGREH